MQPKQILDGAKALKICIIGETILDEFIHSTPLSTPDGYSYIVARQQKVERYLGGVYPVARDLSAFCNRMSLGTNAGDCIEVAAKDKIDLISNSQLKLLKSRFIASSESRSDIGQTMFFLCKFPSPEEWADMLAQDKDKIISEVESSDVTIVYDYGHGFISDGFAEDISRSANFLALNCQANGGHHPFNLVRRYKSIDVLMLNEYESRLNTSVRSVSSHATLALELSKSIKSKFTVVTDAERGSWICEGTNVSHQRSLCSTIIDTVGCGDAMLGFSAIALLQGASPKGALLLGSAAAAVKARMRIHERVTNKRDIFDVLEKNI